MIESLRQSFRNWIFRPRIEQGTIVLTQRRIFIIPTKQGFSLAAMLLLTLIGDINYNLSLGYVLTFLVTMMAVMSMLHAFRNLAHLEIRAGRVDPVFCGQTAQFMLHVNNPGLLARHRIGLFQTGKSFWDARLPAVRFDPAPLQVTDVPFPLPATHRGWLEVGRLTLYTTYPLGLFYCWSYLHFEARCIVYPRPMVDAALPFGNAPDGSGKRSVAGDEDFAGLRKYSPGDALPRIAWKAYAHERGLQVKQFANPVGEELWLDYSNTPDRDKEDKLSRMTRWVLTAQAQGLRYGLRLPNGEVAPDSSDAHRDECLVQLALFEVAAGNP